MLFSRSERRTPVFKFLWPPAFLIVTFLALNSPFISPVIASEIDRAPLGKIEQNKVSQGPIFKSLTVGNIDYRLPDLSYSGHARLFDKPIWERMFPGERLIISRAPNQKYVFSEKIDIESVRAIESMDPAVFLSSFLEDSEDGAISHEPSTNDADLIRKVMASSRAYDAFKKLNEDRYSLSLFFKKGLKIANRGVEFDYFQPLYTSNSWLFFGQIHASAPDVVSARDDMGLPRVDMAAGLGARLRFGHAMMLGANGFYDRSWINGSYYKSQGFGIESAINLSGDLSHSIETKLNFYRGGGIDTELALNIPVYDPGLDLRIMGGLYRFYDTDFIIGSRAGAEVASKGGAVALRYEVSRDNLYDTVHTVSANLSLGFNLEDILHGKNPFHSPREHRSNVLGSATSPVQRVWSRPRTVMESVNSEKGKEWFFSGEIPDRWPERRTGMQLTQLADVLTYLWFFYPYLGSDSDSDDDSDSKKDSKRTKFMDWKWESKDRDEAKSKCRCCKHEAKEEKKKNNRIASSGKATNEPDGYSKQPLGVFSLIYWTGCRLEDTFMMAFGPFR